MWPYVEIGFLQGNQVKIISLSKFESSMTSKKGEFGHRHAQKKDNVITQREKIAMSLQ